MADSIAVWIPLAVMLRYMPPSKPSCAFALNVPVAVSYPPRRNSGSLARLLRRLPLNYLFNYLDANSETMPDGETELYRVYITIPLRL